MSEQKLSDTPECDANMRRCEAMDSHGVFPLEYVRLDFARQLERTLHAKERELAEQANMVHDFPRLMEFYSKHALGDKVEPSCLKCGQQRYHEAAIKHLELPNIYLCSQCATLQSVSAAPQEVTASDREMIDAIIDGHYERWGSAAKGDLHGMLFLGGKQAQHRAAAQTQVTGPDEHGSVYVYFQQSHKGAVGKTVQLKGEVNIDYDKNGNLFGIEFLGVHTTAPQEGILAAARKRLVPDETLDRSKPDIATAEGE